MLIITKTRQFTAATALNALAEMYSYYNKGDKEKKNIPSGILLFF